MPSRSGSVRSLVSAGRHAIKTAQLVAVGIAKIDSAGRRARSSPDSPLEGDAFERSVPRRPSLFDSPLGEGIRRRLAIARQHFLPDERGCFAGTSMTD